VGDADAAYVAMHWRAHSTVMQQHASYDEVLGEVRAELAQRLEDALAAGIRGDRVVVDPGLGFAKTADHNWQVIADGSAVRLARARVRIARWDVAGAGAA
jgi:dihydropteroate synthase